MRIFLIALTVITLTACKAAPVYNVDDKQFSTTQKASLKKIKSAILTASKKAKWTPKPLQPGKILATYSYKANRFSAAVIINYDLDSYSIHYLRSHNLKYNANQPNAQDEYEQNTVEKIFNNRERESRIHKVYNSWVRTLERSINHEISLLNTNQYSNTAQTSAGNQKSSARRIDRTFSSNSSCIKVPDTVESGQAVIKSSRVNLRAGAGKQCPVVGFLTKGDPIVLLGKKGNWLYIQRQDGNNAWIYKSLITFVSSSPISVTNSRPNNTPPPPPAPPAPLSKRVSIAVIQFKTLNKEAQDISLGDLISETFTSALVNSNNFKIIEREQLDKVVKEMEMTQTGFIESTDAVEIGKMLHADAIITGSVALLNDQIQLNARIIEIESAFVISAESATTRYSLENINQTINTIVDKLSQKLMASKAKQNK